MSDWIPLLQTLVWVGLISVILYAGRRSWARIIQTIENRIGQGDDMTLTGPLGLSARIRHDASGLPRLEAGGGGGPDSSTSETAADLEKLRSQLGAEQRGVHLVHVVGPTDLPGQRYEIFAYLHGWKRSRHGHPDDLSDVDRAEFYIGPFFSPSSVIVENTGDSHIGFTTSAYAPVFCLCRITFADGHEVVVFRYLDFESGELVRDAAQR